MNQRLPLVFLFLFFVVFLAGGVGGFLVDRFFPSFLYTPAQETAFSPDGTSTVIYDAFHPNWLAYIPEAVIQNVQEDGIVVEQGGKKLQVSIVKTGEHRTQIRGVDSGNKSESIRLEDLHIGDRVSLSLQLREDQTVWASGVIVLP